MNLVLIQAASEYKQQIVDYLDEYCASGEKVIPTTITKVDYHDFDAYCNHLNSKKYPTTPNRVHAERGLQRHKSAWLYKNVGSLESNVF